MASKVCSFCLAIVACLLIFFAGRFGIANLYAVGLEQTHQRWTAIGSATEQELENASLLSQQMLSLHPGHPHYNSLAATQVQWLLLSLTAPVNIHNKLLFEAANFYRTAIELRPTWPDSYARLARILWQQSAAKDQIFQLITTAKSVGPFDKETLYILAEIGLANWPLLTSDQRMDVFNAVLHGMAHYQTRTDMEQIVTLPLQKESGCQLLALNKLKTKLCGVKVN